MNLTPSNISLPAAPNAPQRLALRGDLLDFTADPGWSGADQPAAARWRPDHWLLVQDGVIAGALPAVSHTPGADWVAVDHSGQLLLPGFIDTHVHSPQLDVIASYGTELLDWLNTYTFPAEQRYGDPVVAEAGAALFLDALLAHGAIDEKGDEDDGAVDGGLRGAGDAEERQSSSDAAEEQHAQRGKVGA